MSASAAIVNAPAVETTAKHSASARVAFRLLAVLLGLLVFPLFELACIAFDWGRLNPQDDPFVGFSNVHPLFELDDSGTSYEISPGRRPFFAAESFPANKTEGAYRVFCLGGSTVQGRPFSTPTAFTTWLELSLKAGEPDREFDVVNCGGISYASYRLVPILEECLKYEPDLFVVCTGHNEFLEERTYAHIKHAPEAVTAAHEKLAGFRSYAVMREAVLNVMGRNAPPATDERSRLPDEVDALLDYRNGVEAYHRNDAWRTGVVRHFDFNVRRMIGLARSRGVPVILVLPPSNLADCPPFKSEHRAGFKHAEHARWRDLFNEARKHYRSDLKKSVELLKKTIEIDDRYADVYYELGKCYEALGRRADARRAYIRARDEDVCPLRIISPMEAALRRIAEDADVPLIDAHALLEREAGDGVLGDFLLVDHVHPSVSGHQKIAGALAAQLRRQEAFHPIENWEAARDESWNAHLKSLDDVYYLRGRRMLENLEAWTKGRADGPPITEHQKPPAMREP